MSCKDCNNYIPSDKYAGGRCSLLGGTAKFPDDPCSAKRVVPGSDSADGKQCMCESAFSPKLKPKRVKPDESALGPDPEDELC